MAIGWVNRICQSGSGQTIRYAIWENEACHDGKTIIFINGRNEFIEKYDELPSELGKVCLTGLRRFITWDHPGQGGSGGRRSHICSFDEYADLACQIIRENLSEGSVYSVIAHSMGALIALYAVGTGFLRPERMFLSSPFLGVPDRWPERLFAQPISFMMVHLGLGYMRVGLSPFGREEKFSGNQRTHSRRKFYRLLAAPYDGRKPTFYWLRAALAAIRYVHRPEALAQLHQVPVSIWIAEEESVVSQDAILKWVSRATNAGYSVTVRHCAGALHEILYEIPGICHAVLVDIGSELTMKNKAGI
ncbi:MAG: alpha/beta hydrolase [Deltaproteobacteria bacterium]|nr:alpha/beta hydrolase [Deltaproteobacteria bacterium]